jgi:hypothetical protein
VVLVVTGLALKLAVTPAGRPDTENETLPVNPFTSVIVIVLVAWLPCATLKLVGLADSV